MNSYEIIVTPDAEADLYEIKKYIAETLLVPDVALNYIRVIRKEMEKLSYMADSIAPEERAALLTLLGAHGEPDGLMPVWAARLSEPGVSWKLRTMKSQWGSCNWRKRLITLNAELARMSRDLVEYVVVHEFTHLQAHDHGPGFRALMDARLPDWRARRRRLSGLGI